MGKSNTHKFREEWRGAAVTKLRPSFEDVALPLPPKIRVSVGLPAGGVASTARGQTWDASASSGGYYEIFIRPELADVATVLTQLVAQLISTAVPPTAIGFSSDYKAAMTLVGLAGKPGAPYASGPLQTRLNGFAEALGPYPHDAIDTKSHAKPKVLNAKKKEKTRLLSAKCSVCGYKVWLARSTADIGLPACPADGIVLVMQDAEPATMKSETNQLQADLPGINIPIAVPEAYLTMRTEPEPSEPAMTVPSATEDLADQRDETKLWTVKFKDAPSKETKLLLKQHGAYYDGKDMCWHGERLVTDLLRNAVEQEDGILTWDDHQSRSTEGGLFPGN